MKPDLKLVVNEIFGPTIQGEGRGIGLPAIFLRLGGCNLKCVWCDTKYTWDWEHYDPAEELHPMTIDEVAQKLYAIAEQMPAHGTLVITGGEPLLQGMAIGQLLDTIWGHGSPMARVGWPVEIETAGTIKPHNRLLGRGVRFNISPKLAHSGNPPHKRRRDDVLAGFMKYVRASNRAFKFVVQQESDLEEVDALVTELGLRPVYIMAEGIDSQTLDDRQKALTMAVIRRNYRLSPRLHVQLFGNRRGV